MELDGRVLVIRRIHVTYTLRVQGTVDEAAIERVMTVHAERCPIYRSLHPQIHITTELQVERS